MKGYNMLLKSFDLQMILCSSIIGKNTMSQIIYYGQQACSATVKSTGSRCNNGGYYQQNDRIFCGVHLNKRKSFIQLPKATAKEKKDIDRIRQEEIDRNIEVARLINFNQGKQGQLRLRRIVARKKPIISNGWRAIFPNYYSSMCMNYGIVLPTLSPMFFRGKINHGQPNLPCAMNIENLWQSARVFTCELDNAGNPGPLFYENRLKFLRDKVPHRRKYRQTAENKIEYLVWTKADGKEIRLSYVESRFLYCYFLSKAIMQFPDEIYFLFHLRHEGVNIELQGPDALPLINEEKQDFKTSLDLEYRAPRRFIKDHTNGTEVLLDLNGARSMLKAITNQFGHEKVVATMLTIEEKDWPWNKAKLIELPDKIIRD